MKLNSDTFRIAGGELARTDSYVDVSVVAITTDGEVTLKEKRGDEEWQMSLDELRRIENEDRMVDGDDVPLPDDDLWGVLDHLSEVRGNYSGVAGAELVDAQYNILKAIIEEDKNESA